MDNPAVDTSNEISEKLPEKEPVGLTDISMVEKSGIGNGTSDSLKKYQTTTSA